MRKGYKVGVVKFGFTLIEVLIVVAIVSVLSSAGVGKVKQQIDKGRDARRKSDIYKLSQSFEEYYNDNGCYPSNIEWGEVSCGETPSFLASYIDKFPCDPITKEKYTYQTIDEEGEFCDGLCGDCYGYRLLARLANEKDKDIYEIGCDEDSCGVESSDGKDPNWGLAMGAKVPVLGFIPGQGKDVGHTDKHDCQHSKDPECESPSPSVEPEVRRLKIRGRFIDYFTHEPIEGVSFVDHSTVRDSITTTSNANGEFLIDANIDEITEWPDEGNSKAFWYYPYCYYAQGISIKRFKTEALQVESAKFDLIDNPDVFPVNSLEMDIGDVTIWPATDFDYFSDKEVSFMIRYPEDGKATGNINFRTQDYSGGNKIPFNYSVRVEFTDREGNIYYSPYHIQDRSRGCDETATLRYFNNEFSWD